MSQKLVRYCFDLNNPPPLTKQQKAELAALKNRPDSEIDLSDIPELDDAFFKNAKPLREWLQRRRNKAGT